ncbi:bactofilin family protein [Agaribacterium haliotis]|uniref:bactofilin family protein n=1 Tax=Agaribacterium haliotis TaxID=2013869 RepID=UPI000BB53CF7|nr:polymer-forming cytoskeletal protein [Agaribacterium haliotis]
MFGSKKDNQFAKGGHTLLDHALVVEGNVRFAGTLDIEGTVNGDVVAEPGVDALVRIREKGCVNGEIHSPKIIVNGCVNGNIYADKHLELAAKAEVNGNVHYRMIEMVKGAQVNGALVHLPEGGAEAKPAPVEDHTALADQA